MSYVQHSETGLKNTFSFWTLLKHFLLLPIPRITPPLVYSSFSIIYPCHSLSMAHFLTIVLHSFSAFLSVQPHLFLPPCFLFGIFFALLRLCSSSLFPHSFPTFVPPRPQPSSSLPSRLSPFNRYLSYSVCLCLFLSLYLSVSASLSLSVSVSASLSLKSLYLPLCL